MDEFMFDFNDLIWDEFDEKDESKRKPDGQPHRYHLGIQISQDFSGCFSVLGDMPLQVMERQVIFFGFTWAVDFVQAGAILNPIGELLWEHINHIGNFDSAVYFCEREKFLIEADFESMPDSLKKYLPKIREFKRPQTIDEITRLASLLYVYKPEV